MRIDRDLVELISAASVRLCVASVEALQELGHEDAAWAPLDSGGLFTTGRDSFINRAIGVGFGGTPAAELLDAAESWFGALGMPSSLELCPWIPDELVAELAKRNYALESFRDVYVHDLTDLPLRSEIDVLDVRDDNSLEQAWSSILESEYDPSTPAMERMAQFNAAALRVPERVNLVAIIDGAPAATGALLLAGQVAELGGATTLAHARRRGAQSALIVDRLHRAVDLGCRLAMVSAAPGGASARNLRRHGFELAFTEAIVQLQSATDPTSTIPATRTAADGVANANR